MLSRQGLLLMAARAIAAGNAKDKKPTITIAVNGRPIAQYRHRGSLVRRTFMAFEISIIVKQICKQSILEPSVMAALAGRKSSRSLSNRSRRRMSSSMLSLANERAWCAQKNARTTLL
jgi:hypothetical protein